MFMHRLWWTTGFDSHTSNKSTGYKGIRTEPSLKLMGGLCPWVVGGKAKMGGTVYASVQVKSENNDNAVSQTYESKDDFK